MDSVCSLDMTYESQSLEHVSCVSDHATRVGIFLMKSVSLFRYLLCPLCRPSKTYV
jgi:hypothetical protein